MMDGFLGSKFNCMKMPWSSPKREGNTLQPPNHVLVQGLDRPKSAQSGHCDFYDLDIVSLLPKELALQVFSYLDAKDISRAAQTCRLWSDIAADDILWRNKNRQIGLPDRRYLQATNNLNSISTSGQRQSSWKLNYIRQHYVCKNWRDGTNKPVTCLPAHRGHLITCMLLTDDNRLISGSDDGTLKVWSVETGNCLFTLQGHEGGVWAAEAEGSLLVSASVDKTIRIWNLMTGDLEVVLLGHSATVRCLALKDGICVSGSRDKSVRVWNVQTDPHGIWSLARRENGCIGVLVGHEDSVRCVRYNGEFIVSGSYDKQIRVWDPQKLVCLNVLIGHTERVYSLQFDGVHIVSGSLDASIRVWDVRTGALKHILVGHESLISGMHQRDHILISGNADSTVKMWNIRTGDCLQTFGSDGFRHDSAVTSVHFDENFVVTSSDDGTCKLWDLHTGRFIRDIVRLATRELGGVGVANCC